MLSNPFNFSRAVPLTEAEFRFGFANAVSEAEAKALYATYARPGPGRPIFQVATASLNPHPATEVNSANATRGPLLSIAGEKDNTVPTVMIESTLKLYHKQSSAVTEFKKFPQSRPCAGARSRLAGNRRVRAQLLEQANYEVIAVQNPLSSLVADVATTKRVIDAEPRKARSSPSDIRMAAR